MMTPRTNPDLIPGAPWWANALLRFGAFGVLAGLLIVMVLQNGKEGSLPTIAPEIRDDNRRRAEADAKTADFMKQYTADAKAQREATNNRLASIEKELVVIRAEEERQRSVISELTTAINRLVEGLEGSRKNSVAPVPGQNGE